MSFFRLIQHLLPNSKSWRLTASKTLQKFFHGLAAALGNPVKQHIDHVWLDIFPRHTERLEEWENQWGLLNTSVLTEQERRDRLTGIWRALGGQSPKYIQDSLHDAGFDVYVHEYWDSKLDEIRNPSNYLNNGVTPYQYITVCKLEDPTVCRSIPYSAACGEIKGHMGQLLINLPTKKAYDITKIVTNWEYIFYIGGKNFGDIAEVSIGRRDEFETLCLKLRPMQHFIGLIVRYG